MVSFSFTGEAMDKILKSLSKVGSGFMILGGAIILLSIFQDHLIGLKIGILTLIFGCIFRLYNGLTKTFIDQVKGEKYPFRYFTLITSIRFFIWFLLVSIYCYLINGIIHIITIYEIF